MAREFKNKRHVIDIENKNFKMYKANKHWIFASAVMLSLLGTGMVSTSNAKADTVNDTVQTTAIQKVNSESEKVAMPTTTTVHNSSAATKEATSTSSSATSSAPSSATSAVTESKAKTASNATNVSIDNQKQDSQAPSSATKTQTTSASSSATKANSSASTSEEKTKSSAASSASTPAKNPSAKSDATSSATTSSNATSSAANSATSSNASSNASTNTSSAASSSATVDADGIKPAQNDNQNKDFNGNTAKATTDSQANHQDQTIDTTKKKTDTDKQNNIQKQANKSGNVMAGIDVLANGTLEIDGSAINGLKINDDGTYSGHLIFTYNGDSLSVQVFENSQISIQIPKQLRDLFNKMKADNSFYEFIQGAFPFQHINLPG